MSLENCIKVVQSDFIGENLYSLRDLCLDSAIEITRKTLKINVPLDLTHKLAQHLRKLPITGNYRQSFASALGIKDVENSQVVSRANSFYKELDDIDNADPQKLDSLKNFLLALTKEMSRYSKAYSRSPPISESRFKSY